MEPHIKELAYTRYAWKQKAFWFCQFIQMMRMSRYDKSWLKFIKIKLKGYIENTSKNYLLHLREYFGIIQKKYEIDAVTPALIENYLISRLMKNHQVKVENNIQNRPVNNIQTVPLVNIWY